MVAVDVAVDVAVLVIEQLVMTVVVGNTTETRWHLAQQVHAIREMTMMMMWDDWRAVTVTMTWEWPRSTI